MIYDERVIAVIPARGGSKAVHRKNIRPLGGKPLIAWSIEVAKAVESIDRIIVSTDDDEIAAVAEGYGAEIYRRPPHLATDQALVVEALRDLIVRLRAEGERGRVMLLLEPTSPFRSCTDIQTCIEELVCKDKDSLATFKTADLNPHRAWSIEDESPSPFVVGANPWQPRQELPTAYQLNGAVYAFRIDLLPDDSHGLLFGRSGAVIMPAERSIDIDTAIDFIIAETLLAKGVIQ